MEENKRIHVQHYYSETPNATPIPEDVQYGEIAVNNADEKMFIKNTTGNIASFSSDEKLIEQIESSLSDYATVDYVDSAFSKVVNDDSLLKVVDENNNVNKTNLKIGNVEIQSGEVSYVLYIEQLNMNDTLYNGIVAEFTGEYREYEWKDGEDADPSNNKGVAMVFRPTEYTAPDDSFVDELFVQIHGWDDVNTTNNISVYTVWAIWDESYETEIQWTGGVRLVRTFTQVADSELTSKLLVNDVPVAVVTDLPKLPEGILTVDNEGNLNKTKLKMSYDYWYEGEEESIVWDKETILDVSKEYTTISATQTDEEESGDSSSNNIKSSATLRLDDSGATLSFYEYENGSAYLTVKNDGAYIASEDYMGEESKILTEIDLDSINYSINNATSLITKHTSNNNIHVTEEERNIWNTQLKDYYNKEQINENFQPKGDYATEKWVKEQGYITSNNIPEVTDVYTKSEADSTFLKKSDKYNDTEVRGLITNAQSAADKVATDFKTAMSQIKILNSKIAKLEEYITTLSNLVESYHGETPGCTDPTDGDEYPGVACDCTVDENDEVCTELEGHIDCNCAEDEGDCQIPGEGGDSNPSGCESPGFDDSCYMLGEVDETPCEEGGEMDYDVCQCGEEGDNACDFQEQDGDCAASSGEVDNMPQCECLEEGDEEPTCEYPEDGDNDCSDDGEGTTCECPEEDAGESY